MDNNQQDITADLTDKQLALCYVSAFNCAYDKPGSRIHDCQCAGYRAVAALAREGWRPIPNDEGAAISLFEPRSNPCRLILPVADGDAQQLAEQLHELADILVSLQIPHWPGRVLRAAELLVHQAYLLAHQQEPAPVPALSPRPPVTAIASAPVLTKERPWERDGWCDEQGRCWMGDPGRGEFIPSWRLCNPWDGSRLKWCLPHWAIPVPARGDAS